MTERERRHAGWLELFYDLLFVVLVAQLAHPLVAHPGWSAAARLLVLFLPAWWVWVGSTLYTNLTGEIGTERRFDVLGQMAILVVMVASASQAAQGHPAMFACAYAGSRFAVLLFRMLERGTWPAGGANWPLLVSAACWLGSVTVPAPCGYLLWFAGLAVEMEPWLRAGRRGSRLQRRLAAGDIETGHLVERFGLFMIIVLGEAIAQIVTAIGGVRATPWALLTGLSAFTVVAMLWWLYFDFGSAVVEKTINARRTEAFRLIRSIFLIGHFLPVVSMLALAAGLGGLVAAAAQGQHAAGSLRLCAAALAVYLVNNGLVGSLAIRYPVRRVLTWLVPNLALLATLTLLADRLIPLVPLLLITGFLAIETLPARRGRTRAQDPPHTNARPRRDDDRANEA